MQNDIREPNSTFQAKGFQGVDLIYCKYIYCKLGCASSGSPVTNPNSTGVKITCHLPTSFPLWFLCAEAKTASVFCFLSSPLVWLNPSWLLYPKKPSILPLSVCQSVLLTIRIGASFTLVYWDTSCFWYVVVVYSLYKCCTIQKNRTSVTLQGNIN